MRKIIEMAKMNNSLESHNQDKSLAKLYPSTVTLDEYINEILCCTHESEETSQLDRVFKEAENFIGGSKGELVIKYWKDDYGESIEQIDELLELMGHPETKCISLSDDKCFGKYTTQGGENFVYYNLDGSAAYEVQCFIYKCL